jgi:hypothetical protein
MTAMLLKTDALIAKFKALKSGKRGSSVMCEQKNSCWTKRQSEQVFAMDFATTYS